MGMVKQMYVASCSPICGFKVRSHKKDEIVDHLKLHGKLVHPKMKMTKKEIEGLIKADEN